MANNLTLSSPAYDTAGPAFGTAALSGGYGVAPGGMIAGLPFAWECRFKRSSAPASLEVIMGQSGTGWMGMTTSGAVHFELGNGSTPTVSFTSAGSVADGNWHHTAISVSSAGFLAFLDGAVVGSSSSIPGMAGFAPQGTPPNGTGMLAVRNHGGSLQFTFNGEVDEAAVWSSSRYTAAFSPPAAAYTGSEAGLLALWHLDGNGVDSTGAALAATIGAPMLSGLVTGGSTAVSGGFANGAPAGLSQVLDGVVTTVPSPTLTVGSGSGASASGTYSYSIPTPDAGMHTIAVNGTGTYAAAGAATGFTTSAAAPVTIPPTHAAVVYSPYNWAAGKTVNAGAYFRLGFTGSSIALNFDVSAQTAPLPQIWVIIDGMPAQQFTLAATVTPTMPAATAAWPKHMIEVVVKSTSEFVSRWSPQAAAVVLSSITLAAGAAASAPAVLLRTVLAFGDSITEGFKTLGSGDTDTSDATLGWAYGLRRLLGCEIGVIGFGGTGLLNAGEGGVPPVGQSFTQLWSGTARNFSPAPSLIVVNEGENDKTAAPATFQAAFQAFLAALLGAVPSCPIAVLRPFSGAQAVAIQAAIQAVGSPRLHYADTTGLFDTTLSVDGQHPLGVANLGAIGPGVAAIVGPLVSGSPNRWSHA